MDFKVYRILFFLMCLGSCIEQSEDIAVPDFDPSMEIAEGVQMIYSDSAKLKRIITTPRREKFYENNILVQKFPLGIRIELFNNSKEPSSTMIAKHAEYRRSIGTLLLKDSVVLTNDQKDELTTTGITWNEKDHTLTTDKFVRLVKASSQDTLYGFGLQAQDDFSRMNIKNLTGKRRSNNE